MRVSILIAFSVSLAAVSACRQADGAPPVKDGDIPNQIEDVAHDLSNVSKGDREGPADLAQDLVGFVDGSPSAKEMEELGRRVAKAVGGRPLSDTQAAAISEQLWLAGSARDLSERQHEQVLNDLRDALMAAGAEKADLESTVAQAGEVLKAASRRPRRWYERY